jgi:hypothetical protein
MFSRPSEIAGVFNMIKRRRLLMLAIAGMLGILCSVPLLTVFFYGGIASALFGLAIVGVLIVCQLPVFWLLKRMGVVPTRASRGLRRGAGND